MNKFNSRVRDFKKDKRIKAREKKQQLALQGKVVSHANAPPPAPMSGKRKRKMERQWRKAQKEALESGLVTLQDIEMIAADPLGSEAKTEKTAGQATSSQQQLKPKKKKGFALRKKMRVRVAASTLKKGGKNMMMADALGGEAPPESDKMME
ncbi:hypothetical protein CBR_g50944 [Chara braunii]|uniref:Uncharacterized protein n=1 Tax=Chara braunii TaxID=69332 RepID=A0A388M7S8_CHABU|nr:hypothetical protein CBR_g50944 [Chara braunii]|eukprot:GBG90600.1 hypothetical protein CBR_g50944 [Chara braunii]